MWVWCFRSGSSGLKKFVRSQKALTSRCRKRMWVWKWISLRGGSVILWVATICVYAVAYDHGIGLIGPTLFHIIPHHKLCRIITWDWCDPTSIASSLLYTPLHVGRISQLRGLSVIKDGSSWDTGNLQCMSPQEEIAERNLALFQDLFFNYEFFQDRNPQSWQLCRNMRRLWRHQWLWGLRWNGISLRRSPFISMCLYTIFQNRHLH